MRVEAASERLLAAERERTLRREREATLARAEAAEEKAGSLETMLLMVQTSAAEAEAEVAVAMESAVNEGAEAVRSAEEAAAAQRGDWMKAALARTLSEAQAQAQVAEEETQ